MRRQLEYSHDVHPNTRESRLGREFGSAEGVEWVEYLGSIGCHSLFAGDVVDDGDLL